MSFYDFSAAVCGFSKFHSTGDEEQISESEAARLGAAIDQPLLWN